MATTLNKPVVTTTRSRLGTSNGAKDFDHVPGIRLGQILDDNNITLAEGESVSLNAKLANLETPVPANSTVIVAEKIKNG